MGMESEREEAGDWKVESISRLPMEVYEKLDIAGMRIINHNYNTNLN